MPEYTTIRVSLDVREALVKLGSKDEDYDDILRRVLGLDPKKEETA